MTGFIGNTTYAYCREELSGEVSTTNEDKAIYFKTMDQDNHNEGEESGLLLEYRGSDSGDFVKINIYCSEEEF